MIKIKNTIKIQFFLIVSKKVYFKIFQNFSDGKMFRV